MEVQGGTHSLDLLTVDHSNSHCIILWDATYELFKVQNGFYRILNPNGSWSGWMNCKLGFDEAYPISGNEAEIKGGLITWLCKLREHFEEEIDTQSHLQCEA